MKLLEACKTHGGPLTPDSLSEVDSLSSKQLLEEVAYLRSTIAPDIRQKRRVRTPAGKFKMENFTDSELRVSIRNVLKPETEISETVESLLLSTL